MRVLVAALTLAFAVPAFAQDVTVSPNDSIQTVLAANKGKRVTVRLSGGQELTGVVREATARLVVIGAVSGREFFDAVVATDKVEAVLVRTKP